MGPTRLSMLTYTKMDDVAHIGLDDGKANAVGHGFVDAMNEGLERALADASCVLITGRPGLFSAGFDLKEFDKGTDATAALVNKGAHMLLRIFTHPQPVVIACAGHAVAAGAFMLLAADTRIGTQGDFKIGLNETAIGMTLPVFGVQLAMARLSKRYQTAAAVQGTLFDPQAARDAGFFDIVVDPGTASETAPDPLHTQSLKAARELAELPTAAFAANKLAMRAPYISAIETSLPAA